MQEPIFYVNGEFVNQSQALIGVSDLALLRGYGIFELTITYNRKPFRLKEHLERLQKSARIIDLDLPWSEGELTKLVYKTLDKNAGGEKTIRILVTGGESQDGMTPTDTPGLIVMVTPEKNHPEKYYREGIKAITFPARREIPRAKTINYVQAIRAPSIINSP